MSFSFRLRYCLFLQEAPRHIVIGIHSITSSSFLLMIVRSYVYDPQRSIMAALLFFFFFMCIYRTAQEDLSISGNGKKNEGIFRKL